MNVVSTRGNKAPSDKEFASRSSSNLVNASHHRYQNNSNQKSSTSNNNQNQSQASRANHDIQRKTSSHKETASSIPRSQSLSPNMKHHTATNNTHNDLPTSARRNNMPSKREHDCSESSVIKGPIKVESPLLHPPNKRLNLDLSSGPADRLTKSRNDSRISTNWSSAKYDRLDGNTQSELSGSNGCTKVDHDTRKNCEGNNPRNNRAENGELNGHESSNHHPGKGPSANDSRQPGPKEVSNGNHKSEHVASRLSPKPSISTCAAVSPNKSGKTSKKEVTHSNVRIQCKLDQYLSCKLDTLPDPIRLSILMPRIALPSSELSHCKFERFYRVEEHPNGGAKTLHLYYDEIAHFNAAELDAIAREFLTEAFREEPQGVARYVLSVVHNAASYMPDLMEYIADFYPQLTVKTNVMGHSGSDIETTSMSSYRDQVHRNYSNGIYRFGPLNQLSLVGTVHEEVGGYFPDLLSMIEESPFARFVTPWGEMSSINMNSPQESNDGPIFWIRPGEQLVPTAEIGRASCRERVCPYV